MRQLQAALEEKDDVIYSLRASLLICLKKLQKTRSARAQAPPTSKPIPITNRDARMPSTLAAHIRRPLPPVSIELTHDQMRKADIKALETRWGMEIGAEESEFWNWKAGGQGAICPCTHKRT
eukprot:3007122-Rhodomonas_salina.1